METVKLDRLLITEVSGVDDPANQLPGWMVTKSVEKAESETIVAKIKGILSLGPPTDREDIDMEKDELLTILDERDTALVAKVAEAVAVAKSAAPAEGEGATGEAAVGAEAPAAAEVSVALTIEDVQKAVAEGVAPYNEIFEKVLDRLEGVESHLGVAARKSLDGQESGEGEPVTKSTPDLGDAITRAFKR